MNTEAIYQKATERFGTENQVAVAIEELSELQKELCKHLRGETNADHIAEEMADVTIMLEQMVRMFGVDVKVRDYKKQKLVRLAARVGI